MERQIELLGGIGASVLGLTGVVVEAQALSSPLNPTVALLLGTNHPGAWDALQIAQHALLPMAIVLLIPALGAYLHVVHEHIAGQAMLIKRGDPAGGRSGGIPPGLYNDPVCSRATGCSARVYGHCGIGLRSFEVNTAGLSHRGSRAVGSAARSSSAPHRSWRAPWRLTPEDGKHSHSACGRFRMEA